jgi:WD40 repeat protein
LVVVVDKPRSPVLALPSGVRIGRLKHVRGVTDAAFGPAGRFVASTGRDRIGRIWGARTWEEAGTLVGHVGQLLAVDLDRSGKRVVTGSTDKTARVWWRSTGGLIFSLIGHTGQVFDVKFGPGRAIVTASGDGTARTWRPTGTLAHVLRGHRGAVRSADYLSRDLVVTAGADGTVRLWDPGTSIELVPANAARGPSPPRRRAVSADGRVTAVADGRIVRLRSPSGENVLSGHSDDVNAVSFSADGRRLVTAGADHDVVVWDVESGEEAIRVEEAQSASVEDARFSPDGRWLVTAGPESARVWTADGRLHSSLYGPKDPLTAVGFERDSKTIVTREKDGVVRRYVCELCGQLDELVEQGESRLRATRRTLTEAERRRYLG